MSAIPFEALQPILERYGQKQLVLVGFDGEQTHVVTLGDSVEDADRAAAGGDSVKRALGWPEKLCGDLPPRVAKLVEERDALIEELAAVRADREIKVANAADRTAELERAFSGFACEVFALSIAARADAAIVGNVTRTEVDSIAALATLVEEHRAYRSEFKACVRALRALRTCSNPFFTFDDRTMQRHRVSADAALSTPLAREVVDA